MQFVLLQFLQALVVSPHTHDRQVPMVHLQQLAIFTCRVNYRISSVKAGECTPCTNTGYTYSHAHACIKHTDTRTNEYTFYTLLFILLYLCLWTSACMVPAHYTLLTAFWADLLSLNFVTAKTWRQQVKAYI